MKIEKAYLCEDCQEVTESDGHGGCEVCGSPALLNLAKILNRNPQEEILNFAPRIAVRVENEDVFVCAGSGRRGGRGGHGKHAA
jgi:hypothetical protein